MSIKEEEISGNRLKARQKALQKELSLTVALSKQLFARWSCIFYAQKTLSGPSRNLVVGPIPYIIWTHQKAEMSNVQYVFLSAISHNNGEVFLVMTNINNIQKTTTGGDLPSKSTAQSPGLAERKSCATSIILEKVHTQDQWRCFQDALVMIRMFKFFIPSGRTEIIFWNKSQFWRTVAVFLPFCFGMCILIADSLDNTASTAGANNSSRYSGSSNIFILWFFSPKINCGGT